MRGADDADNAMGGAFTMLDMGEVSVREVLQWCVCKIRKCGSVAHSSTQERYHNDMSALSSCGLLTSRPISRHLNI